MKFVSKVVLERQKIISAKSIIDSISSDEEDQEDEENILQAPIHSPTETELKLAKSDMQPGDIGDEFGYEENEYEKQETERKPLPFSSKSVTYSEKSDETNENAEKKDESSNKEDSLNPILRHKTEKVEKEEASLFKNKKLEKKVTFQGNLIVRLISVH